MALKRGEQDDLILAAKETLRQWLALERRLGNENFDEALSNSDLACEVTDFMNKTLKGEITPEQAQAEMLHFDESVDEMVQRLDDPAVAMQHRAGKEAEAKELSQTAELLASDAQRGAAEGISEQDWIDEVRRGYEGDPEAWLGCRQEIVTLRENGPWAWPKAEQDDRATGASSS
jgi:hypothetical protein